jgi:hypothetical protein
VYCQDEERRKGTEITSRWKNGRVQKANWEKREEELRSMKVYVNKGVPTEGSEW